MSDRLKGSVLVAIQFVLMAGLVLLPAGDDWRQPSAFLSQAPAVLCFVAAFLSFWSLGKARAANPVPTEQAELVTTGIFSVIRHPTYTFLLAGFLLLTWRSAGFAQLGLWLLLLLLFNFKARFEERLLQQRFTQYGTYLQRTGRFLPRLRP